MLNDKMPDNTPNMFRSKDGRLAPTPEEFHETRAFIARARRQQLIQKLLTGIGRENDVQLRQKVENVITQHLEGG